VGCSQSQLSLEFTEKKFFYVYQEGKPFVEVQYMGGKKVFSPEEVCVCVCVCV
jgi:hypothetical protein